MAVRRGLIGIFVVTALAAASAMPAFAAVTPNSGPELGGTSVVVDVPGFEQVSAGRLHTVALAEDGSVWAWGDNSSGQLGDGTGVSSAVPVRVIPAWGSVSIMQVAAGEQHSLAVGADGSVWAWGNNGTGQLGDGSTTMTLSPVQVATTGGALKVTQVAAGGQHTLALADDGSVWGWGDNTSGQLGDGSGTSSPLPVPVSVAWGSTSVTQLSAGKYQSIALTADGALWVWGGNNSGQYGNGTTTSSLTPVPVPPAWGTASITQVSTSEFFVAALASDGTVWAWGSNPYGQLGDGTTTDSPTPVPVTATWGARTITHVTATFGGNALALADDGTVWAWGNNGLGQLGTGTTTDEPVPAQTSAPWGARTITQLTGGDGHAEAIASDGTLWAWGYNNIGQLGTGTTTGTTVPVRAGWSPITVSFDNDPGINVTDNDNNTATATTPPHPAGTVDVIVGTQFQNGTTGPSFTTAPGFTYIAAPVITTTTMPTTATGTGYSSPVEATGTGPITWALISGSLPPGLTLDPTSGLVSGTPTAPGTYTFTVSASNAGGTDTQELSISITATSTPINPTPAASSSAADPGSPPGLADTGSGLVTPLLIGAGALVLLGAVTLLARRLTHR